MYLIIERSEGNTHAYFEDKKHFKSAQEYRKDLTEIRMTNLDLECNLELHGDEYYIVIPVKKKKLMKMRKGTDRSESLAVDSLLHDREDVCKTTKKAKKKTKKAKKKR